MIQDGDGVVVGFSGGPDSTALLHLFYSFKERYNIGLAAAHLNHKFRPGDAERDAEYAEDFCRKRDIPCVVRTIDVTDMAAREGLSAEQAGRKARYDLFNEVMRDNGLNKIAVAHNEDDQVETVLMRLIRGAGVSGLGGIRPLRGNIIRPLLEAPRFLIEEYCERNGLEPVTDKTNFLPIYFRNKIRLELLPYLRENYNKSIDRALLDMADILRNEDRCLDDIAADKFYGLLLSVDRNRIKFPIDALTNLPIALRRRVLRKGVEHLLGDIDNLELVHIQKICGLLEAAKTGKQLNLPRGLVAGIEYDCFFLALGEPGGDGLEAAYRMKIPGKTDIPEIKGEIEATIISTEAYKREVNNTKNNWAFLDFEKTGGTLTIKGREAGDKFVPLGMKGTKKLKDFFIDEKVPKHKRDLVPIIRNELGIVWIGGYRIDERFKVSKDTSQVLKLELRYYLPKEEY